MKGYDSDGFYDDAVDECGRPQEGYADLFDAIDSVGPARLARRVDASIERMGATFNSGDDEPGFPVCPVPRLIQAEEWAHLEEGLAQRARALNMFVADVYGDQEIVHAGVIGSHVIAGADHFEPAMAGVD